MKSKKTYIFHAHKIHNEKEEKNKKTDHSAMHVVCLCFSFFSNFKMECIDLLNVDI
jgi:hypothetical protein